ncbi:MAG TPA: redoxin domain-containing protein [Synechococcales cyanobacterium M55_K2018_004]|nr:redoxin domain-containing protein [Synechococcales cyanobacterium M55_K2018_004]
MLTVNEKNFSNEVLGSSTPVLVNFWAPWCGLCRMMTPLLSNLQTEWEGQIKLVSVNADENLKLANTYRLTSLPTVLLLDRGTVIHRFDHFNSYEDLRNAACSFQSALAAVLNYSCSA